MPCHTIPYHKIPSHTIYQILQTVIIQSFFKLDQARSSKFCMIVDLDNTNKLYQAIPYHTTIYQVIPNISNCHKSVIFQTKYLKFSVVVDSNRPYHDILYHTLKYQIIPNTKYFKLS